jgi:uncharacterized protein DUF4339
MDAEWFIGRDGQSKGPFSFQQLVTAAKDGHLTKEDLVWQQGMETWQPSASIAGIWEPPDLPQQSNSTQNATDDSSEIPFSNSEGSSPDSDADSAIEPDQRTAVPKEPSTNFLLRHWRGQLSLAKSYWIVGVLFSVIALILATMFGEALAILNPPPIWLGICLTTFLVTICVFTIWQLVGVWRSAGSHIITTKRYFWAIAARVAVVLGVIRMITDFSIVIVPMLSESVQLAMGRDDTPAYEIRLLRDGREIELAGGMPFGTATEVRKFLDAAPGVEVIHLNSVGGRIAEGIALLKLFRERKLATYTSVDCVSACTIAFLGGSKRYLSNKATLGFHSASFGSLDQEIMPELNSEMRAALKTHGAPSWFIDKALSTSSASMWYPTQKELIEAKIVSTVVDPAHFAMSGIKDWRDSASLERRLSRIPYVAALKKHNPSAYAKIASRFTDAVQLGKSEIELTAEVQKVFSTEILPGYLQSAPDAALVRYWDSQIAEVRHLYETAPQICLEHLELVPKRKNLSLANNIPPALLAEDLASLAAMIEATHTSPAIDSPAPKILENDFVIAFSNLEKATPGAAAMVFEPQKHTSQPKQLCGSFVAFYDAVFAMPPKQTARILRSIGSGS